MSALIHLFVVLQNLGTAFGDYGEGVAESSQRSGSVEGKAEEKRVEKAYENL